VTKKKLELKNLELNDVISHLEKKTKEIEDMMLEMVTKQNKVSCLWLFTYNVRLVHIIVIHIFIMTEL